MVRKSKRKKRKNPSLVEAGLSGASGATGAAITVAALSGSPVAAGIAFVPPAIKYGVEKLLWFTADRSQQRLVEDAQEAAGLDEEQLKDAIGAAGPEAVPLTAEAFQVAAKTLDEQKIKALGRLWVEGLLESECIDENLLMVRSLAQIDAVHIQVLSVLPHESKSRPSVTDIAKRFPKIGAPLRGVLGQLELAGFTSQSEGLWTGESTYGKTEWGQRALDYLGATADSVEADPAE